MFKFLVFLTVFSLLKVFVCIAMEDSDVKPKPMSTIHGENNIRENIKKVIESAETRLAVVYDQMNDQDIINLVKNDKAVEKIVIIGSKNKGNNPLLPEGWVKTFYGKMHNKFVVADDTVITGSANATYSAFNNNVESCICIKDEDLANIYYNYAEFIQGYPVFDEGEKLRNLNAKLKKLENNKEKALVEQGIQSIKDTYSKQVREYLKKTEVEAIIQSIEFSYSRLYEKNKNDIKPSICIKDYYDVVSKKLDTTFDIPSFLASNMKENSHKNISMFLLDKDFLQYLEQKGVKFSKSDAVVVDDNNYDKNNFVKDAISYIKGKGVSCFSISKDKIRDMLPKKQYKEDENNNMHDKLILVGLKSVMLGSVGFTRDVLQGNNFENMILIKDEGVYEFFNKHFDNLKNASKPIN